MKVKNDMRINYMVEDGATLDDEVEFMTRGGIVTACLDCVFGRFDLVWNFLEMCGVHGFVFF